MKWTDFPWAMMIADAQKLGAELARAGIEADSDAWNAAHRDFWATWFDRIKWDDALVTDMTQVYERLVHGSRSAMLLGWSAGRKK